MRKLVAFFIIAVAIAGGIGIYLWTLPTKDASSKAAEVTVEATALLNAFSADENSANEQFLGKIVEVHGVIKQLKVDDSDNAVVVLESGSPMSAVVCNMSNPASELPSSVKAGSEARIKGECTGYLMDVVLERCVVIE